MSGNYGRRREWWHLDLPALQRGHRYIRRSVRPVPKNHTVCFHLAQFTLRAARGHTEVGIRAVRCCDDLQVVFLTLCVLHLYTNVHVNR